MDELKALMRTLDDDVKAAHSDIKMARRATETLTRVNRLKFRIIVVAVLLLAGAVGGVIYAVYEARHVSSCLDHTLGDRNPVTTRDRNAQIGYAHAQDTSNKAHKAWTTAERVWAATDAAWTKAALDAETARTGSYAQGEAFGRLVELTRELNIDTNRLNTAAITVSKAQDAFSAATTTFLTQLIADQKLSAAHPLGRCT